jgi:hypothetical protein
LRVSGDPGSRAGACEGVADRIIGDSPLAGGEAVSLL